MPRHWTDVADGIRVCHSAIDATATTVVRSGDRVLLVDAAWVPSELDDLADDLTGDGLRVDAGFSTHAHHDHVLWHPRLGPAPRYASNGTAVCAAAERAAILSALGPGWPDRVRRLVGRVTATDDLAPWAEMITHDGHATGHTALWFGRQRVLLAGDMLSDTELPLLAETGPAAYHAGLQKLRPYVERAEVVVPGHGAPTRRPMQRWLADRHYLEVLLQGRDPQDPRRSNPGMPEAHAANVAATHRT